MQTIYLPTFAANRNDVGTVLSILEKDVLESHPGEFNIGLEIYGKMAHFQEEEVLAEMAENIKSVAGDIRTIVHGIVGDIYTGEIADISKENGRVLLMAYINLAKKLGSVYVHTHGGIGYRGLKTPVDKPEVLDKARATLLEGLKASGGIPIGIENIPSPSCHDLEINPEKVWSDYVEGIDDCMQVVGDTPLKITFDTCHYGASRDGYIDLIEPVERIRKQLHHLHVSDTSGYWKPYVSKGGEGSIPGEGRIGKDSFAKFFRYIRKNHPDIGICTEAYPEDFANPVEFGKAIRRVCKWLSD